MKYKVSNRLIDFAHSIAKIPGMKMLLKPFFYPYLEYMSKKRNQQFRKHAIDVLQKFANIIDENGIEYTLAFGTLLGAVREKGFIKHDIDIDVAMWAEDWSPNLRKYLENGGFKLLHTHEVDKGLLAREETYSFNNVTIDIFYFYPAIDDYPYCCDFLLQPNTVSRLESMKVYGGCLPRRIELPIKRERMLTEFEGHYFYIPKNAHEILEFRYGESYMTPNPNWGIRSYNCHIVEWKDKLGVYKEY